MRNARRLLAALLAVVMLIPSILVPGYAAETTGFKDVREDSWYANAVDYVSAAGYMKGTSKDAFSPGEDVTRAMFVTILSRVARAQTDNTVSAFGDVAANMYYSGAIEWAAEKEIVNGVGGGLFAPYRSITRQDLAVMLYRFVNAMGYELSAGESRTYTDEAAISAYAADAVRFVASTGLFAGYQDGSFRPKATATRAQTAVIVMRLAQLLDGQIVDPEPMPAQSFDQTSEQMQVSVNAPEGALPENTKMTVSRVTDEAALAELASKVGAEVLGAADISFAKDGAELEPARKVSVRISLDALQSAKNPAVVHVRDDGSFEYVSSSVVATRGKADAIEFEADSFSVYAVTDNQTNATLTISFYARTSGTSGGWEIVNKQIIRANQLGTGKYPIADPGVPNITTSQAFEGWIQGTSSFDSGFTYGNDATTKTVKQINEDYQVGLTGNTEIVYYAAVYDVVYVTYHDQNGAVLMTESYHKNSSNEASVTIDWPYVPFTGGYTFTGWTPDIDEMGDEPTYSANPTVYRNGQNDTISATLNLYPYVQEGYWLSFNNNLEQNNTKNGFDDPTTASYTAPVFAASGVNPTQPTDPKRPGYTFGGWYDNPSLSGNKFNFNTSLTADTTLYAKWTPKTNGTSYMVVFWVQSVSDEVNTSDNHKEYDFGFSEIRTGTACSNAALTISNSGTDADNRRGYNSSSSYGSLVIAFNQTNTISKNGWSSVNGTKPIRGDGGTVLNVYYDRRAITYIFADSYNQYYGYTNPRTYSGLYGQPFSEEAFPATGTQFWLCREANATINRYIDGFTFFDTTNSTYHFVPNTLTGLKNVYEKTQKLNADGTGVLDEYDLKYTYFVQSNGTASIGSDTFPGFAGYKYNYQRDSLTNGANNFPSDRLTVNGSSITGNGAYLYFNRLAYDLDFNSNGTHVRHETVYFEAPLSRFADYVPDNGPRECFFDGWFSDQQLTQKHNLLTATMPNGTKTVFAKWTPKKYRVILNNVSPSDGVTAPSGAQASFLVNGGERIDKDALECFTCDGKRLMGWYTDPEFKHPFNPESLIHDTVSDVYTYYGEKMPDESDDAYKTRMNGATRTGTDSITNATWDDRWDTDDPDSYAVQRTVRSQLQLYALWRADPEGVVGIKVRYLGDHAENDKGYFETSDMPHTVTMDEVYTDQALAAAHSASVPSQPDADTKDEGRRFLYWEILDKYGNPTGEIVYPGAPFTVDINNAVEIKTPLSDPTHTNEGASAIVSVAAVAPTCYTTQIGSSGGNAVTQPKLSSGKADSSANLTNLSANANPNPVTATTDKYEKVTSLEAGKKYVLVFKNSSNADYIVTNLHTSSSYGEPYAAPITITADGNYFTITTTDSNISDISNCQLKSGGSSGAWTLESVANEGYYLGIYRYTSYSYYAAFVDTATTWDWNSSKKLVSGSNQLTWYYNNRYYYINLSNSGKAFDFYKLVEDTTYTVTVDSSITNGTVTADKATAAEGDIVTLTVSPADGYEIGTVTYTPDGGSAVPIYPDNGEYSFTMPAANVTVSATFSSVATNWKVSFVDEDGRAIPGMEDILVPKDAPILYTNMLPNPDKTDYYFLGWYQGDTACTFPMTVNSDIVLTLKYSPKYAYDYTLTLRAVYGPYNPDATTHIYWYANNGTEDHNGAGERFVSTVIESGSPTERLPFNAQVDIPRPTGSGSQLVFAGDNDGTLVWEDHVFLGWARVDNGGSSNNAQAKALTADDLYLKWDGSKYLVKNDSGEFVEFNSQKVYADETTPYHDMYAVWAGFYYIYHSSDGTLEAVQVPFNARETKNLVAEVKTNYLYGGYYTGTGAVVSVDDAEMRAAKDSILNAPNFWNYTDFCVASGSVTETSLIDEGAVVYNGTSIKHTVDNVTVPFWQKGQAYRELGTQLAPTAGTVYYLKEVPTSFLPNRLVYVKADKNTQLYDGTPIKEGELISLYLLTAVDDRNYAANGFMVGTAHTGQNVSSLDENTTGPADTVSRVFTIFVKNGKTYSYNANALNPSIRGPQGMDLNLVGFVAAKHLDYDWIQAHKGQTDGVATFYLKPYWTTLDGVTVTQDTIKGVNITADGKGISFVNVQ